MRCAHFFLSISIMKLAFKKLGYVGGLFALSSLSLALTAAAQDYTGANLFGENLSGKDLAGAVFTDAEITGVNFSSAKNLSAEQIYSTKSYKDGALEAVVFSYLEMGLSWSFAGMGLGDCEFYGANISGVSFEGANFYKTQYTYGVSASFQDAVLDNVNFRNATFSGIQMGGNFNGAKISGSDFSGARFSSENGGSEAAFFENATVENSDFSNASLANSQFRNSTFKNVNFANADFSGSQFSVGDIMAATFENADLRGADLSGKNGDFIAKNVIMQDGTIAGLSMRSSGDLLTVRGAVNGVNAKIDGDSEILAGTIELLDGAVIEIESGSVLTLSDAVSIVFDASGGVEGAGDLFSLGSGATIAMSGYSTDSEAREAFVKLFKDSDGNAAGWSPESVAGFVGAAVPEPAYCAAAFGALALAFAARRRRN